MLEKKNHKKEIYQKKKGEDIQGGKIEKGGIYTVMSLQGKIYTRTVRGTYKG